AFLSYIYYLSFIFFFKQKTAYDIGLGIPAEPLFRSVDPNFGRRVRNRHVFCKLFNWRRLRTRRPKLGSTLPVGSVRIKCTAWKGRRPLAVPYSGTQKY